jgi:preprotein translocase subunit SecA
VEADYGAPADEPAPPPPSAEAQRPRKSSFGVNPYTAMPAGPRPEELQTNRDPAPSQQASSGATVGRNDPCPCGSGKKYKACHGRTG